MLGDRPTNDDEPLDGESAVPNGIPRDGYSTYDPRLSTLGGPTPGGGSKDDDLGTSPTWRLLSSPQPNPDHVEELSQAAAELESAEGFSFLRLVGRGAMGEVWEAIQRRLWRSVAVKRLRLRSDTSLVEKLSLMRLFQAEAMTAALLDHPNIVPVYDLGVDESGLPLIAMKLVEGTSWDEVLHHELATLPFDQYLARNIPILVQVCQAVTFAHAHGVIHRDLKPSQVMIGAYGEVLLMDWGLAVMVGDPPGGRLRGMPDNIYPNLETAGNPAGTPGFMAPEQTDDTSARLGTWTDSYLLGGTLFYLLCGRAPHPGEDGESVFAAARKGVVRPMPPSMADRVIPDVLVELALEAMTPEPAGRPHAIEILGRLQDYVSGSTRRAESIAITDELAAQPEAQTYSYFVDSLARLGEAQRQWPANPAVGPMSERLLAGYTRAALATGDLALARAQAERLPPKQERALLLHEITAAEERVLRQRRQARQLRLGLAAMLAIVIVGGTMFTVRLGRANKQTQEQLMIATIAKQAEQRASTKAREELERATLLLSSSLVEQGRQEDAINRLLSIPPEARHWEWSYVMTGAFRDLWTVPMQYLIWSPSNKYAIARSTKEGLCVVSADSGRVLARLRDDSREPVVATFSRDESRMALAQGADPITIYDPATWRPITIYDTATWQPVSTFDAPTSDAATVLEFSPDNTRMAWGDSVGRAAIVDLATGDVQQLSHHIRRLRTLAWGEKCLLVASSDTVTRLHPDGTEEMLFSTETWADADQYVALTSSADDRYFAIGYPSSTPLVCRIDEGPMHRLPVPTEGLMFVPNQPWLLVTGGRGNPKFTLWNVDTGEEIPMGRPGDGETEDSLRERYATGIPAGGEFSPDGSRLLLHEYTGHALYTFSPPLRVQEQAEIKLQIGDILRFHPDGESAWISSTNGITRLVSLISTNIGIPTTGSTPSFGPGDKYTASITTGWLEQRDTETGEVVFIGGYLYYLYMGAPTSADGKVTYLPGMRAGVFTVEKHDRVAGKQLAEFTFPEDVSTVAVQPDRHLLLRINDMGTTASIESLATDVATHVCELPVRDAEDPYIAARFSLDGSLLFLGTYSGELLALDPLTGDVKIRRRAHSDWVSTMGYVHHGEYLMTGSQDRKTRLWDPKTLEPRYTIEWDFDLAGAAISADGTRIVGWPDVGAPEIKLLATGETVTTLERVNYPMRGVRFLDDDTRIIASSGLTARLWDTENGREVYHIEHGFGAIGENERLYVQKPHEYAGNLIELAPLLRDQVDADSARSLLHEWEIERLRRWRAYRVRAKVPGYIELFSVLDGTVTGSSWMNAIQRVGEFAAQTGLGDAAMRRVSSEILARLWINPSVEPKFFSETERCVSGEVFIRNLLEFPDLADGVVGTAAILHGARAGRAYETLGVDNVLAYRLRQAVRALEGMAIAFELRGDRARAEAVARRAFAIRSVMGWNAAEAEACLRRLGAELPPTAPPNLQYGPATSHPPHVLTQLAAGTDLKTAWANYAVARNAYLECAPPLDWDAIDREQLARPDAVPYPSGLSFHDLGKLVRPDVERAVFNGKLLAEALAEQQEQFAKDFMPKGQN